VNKTENRGSLFFFTDTIRFIPSKISEGGL